MDTVGLVAYGGHVESREAWLERMSARRVARGLPPTLDDPAALATLAAVLMTRAKRQHPSAHGHQR